MIGKPDGRYESDLASSCCVSNTSTVKYTCFYLTQVNTKALMQHKYESLSAVHSITWCDSHLLDKIHSSMCHLTNKEPPIKHPCHPPTTGSNTCKTWGVTLHRPACYQTWNEHLTSCVHLMCFVCLCYSFSHWKDPGWALVLFIADESSSPPGEAQLLNTRRLNKHHVRHEFQRIHVLYFLEWGGDKRSSA